MMPALMAVELVIHSRAFIIVGSYTLSEAVYCCMHAADVTPEFIMQVVDTLINVPKYLAGKLG
jgi:predicted nucleic-acid-binding protein